jgi:hypothetical protein
VHPLTIMMTHGKLQTAGRHILFLCACSAQCYMCPPTCVSQQHHYDPWLFVDSRQSHLLLCVCCHMCAPTCIPQQHHSQAGLSQMHMLAQLKIKQHKACACT